MFPKLDQAPAIMNVLHLLCNIFHLFDDVICCLSRAYEYIFTLIEYAFPSIYFFATDKRPLTVFLLHEMHTEIHKYDCMNSIRIQFKGNVRNLKWYKIVCGENNNWCVCDGSDRDICIGIQLLDCIASYPVVIVNSDWIDAFPEVQM